MIDVKPLKEIASFIRTGKTPPTKQEKYFNGEINWYSPGDLDKTKFLFDAKRTITQLAIEDKKAITYPKNTLLIGCIGNIGKLGITSELSSSNQQLTGVLPNDKTDVNYLYYWFYGNKKVLESYSNNAVVPILNNRTLETIQIPHPPLDQQKKIAAILDAADAYRQKTKALITKYEELTQSLFLDMFGDMINNQKDWNYIPFGNVFNSLRYGTSSPPVYSKKGIPFVRATNVKGGGIVLKGMAYISQEEASKIQKCKLKESDLIIVRSGANTGDCSRIPNEYHGAYGGFDIIVEIDEPYSTYYNFLINTKSAKALIEPLTRRAGQPHLNSKQITELQVFDIPVKLQNQFADIIQAIEVQKTQAQASLAQAEDLFNSLLQRAFKGKLIN